MDEVAGIVPEWPAPRSVRAFQTVRATGALDGLRLPAAPSWLEQVHGAEVAYPAPGEQGARADAAVSRHPGTVLVVRTADCLPVLLCGSDGDVVAAAHAGWRGLAAGVLEATVSGMETAPGRVMAWLGPAIGQDAFEVGPEVREAFVATDPGAAAAFRPGAGDRLHADLVALARRRLAALGVTEVYGGTWCTYDDPRRFHSYRRDHATGRMAAMIWMDR